MMRWLRGFFSSGDPIVKLCGALSEPDAFMRKELLENNGVASMAKNMAWDAAYGVTLPFGFDLFVKQSDVERATEILGPLMDNDEDAPSDGPDGQGNGQRDGYAR